MPAPVEDSAAYGRMLRAECSHRVKIDDCAELGEKNIDDWHALAGEQPVGARMPFNSHRVEIDARA
jgi:hypothetical protein